MNTRRLAIAAVSGAMIVTGFSITPTQAAAPPPRISVQAEESAEESVMALAVDSGERVEDESQRTETDQVFANPDGTWTLETASDPVRVKDAEGEWHDIDLTLVERDGKIEPKYAAADVSFSDGGDRTLASMSEEGRDLAWKLPTDDAVLPAPVLDGNTATYKNVAPGQDLLVEAHVNGFSHSLVLNERPDFEGGEEIIIEMPVATDGTEITEVDGGIQIEAPSGQTVAAAPQPLMWDAGTGPGGVPDNVEEVDVTVSQPGEETSDGGTAGSAPVVSLTPDEEFLAAPTTEYPVTIDPTYSAFSNWGDTWAQSDGSFEASQAGSDELRAGTFDAGDHKARSWIKFNTSLIDGKKINSATLSLLNFGASTCSGSAVRVSRVTEAWWGQTGPQGQAALSWSNQPSVTYAEAVDVSTAKGYSGSCPGGFVTWNVAEIVQKWAHGAADYGFRINAVNETINSGWRRWRSVNFGTNEPVLSVNYTSYPDTPTNLSATPSGAGEVSSLMPTLSAKVRDADGGNVRARFEVSSPSGPVWSGDGSVVADGLTGGYSSLSVPADKLVAGISYTVKAYAFDGSLLSGRNGTYFGYTTQALAVSRGAGGEFVPLSSSVLDTSATPQIGDFGTPMPAGTWRSVQLTGRGGVPTSGVTSVALSVTALTPASAGSVAIAPSGTTGATYLNYAPGVSSSATATVDLGSAGAVSIKTTSAVDLRVDVQGYFTAVTDAESASYLSVAQARLVDTSTGLGVSQGDLSAGDTATIQVGGLADVPDGASAAFVNIRTIGATGSGFFSVYPADASAAPSTRTAFGPGTVASGQIVPLSDSGAFKLHVAGSATGITVDVLGFFETGWSSGAHSPAQGEVVAQGSPLTVASGGIVSVPVPLPTAFDPTMATPVLRIRVVGATAPGTLKMWRGGDDEPNTSMVDYGSNGGSNVVVIPVGDDGSVSVRNTGTEAVALTIDQQGWFSPPSNDIDEAPINHSNQVSIAGSIENNGVPVANAALDVTVMPRGDVLDAIPDGADIPTVELASVDTASDGTFEVSASLASLPDTFRASDGSISVELNASNTSVTVPYSVTVEPEVEMPGGGAFAALAMETPEEVNFDLATAQVTTSDTEDEDWTDTEDTPLTASEIDEATTSVRIPESSQIPTGERALPGIPTTPNSTCTFRANGKYTSIPEKFMSIYNWAGAKYDLTQTTSSSHFLGVGFQLTGAAWKQTGTLDVGITESSQHEAGRTIFGQVNKTYRNKVQYKKMDKYCPTRTGVKKVGTKVVPTGIGWFFDDTYSPQSVYKPWASNCHPIKFLPSHFWKAKGEAYTKSGGVSLGFVSLSAQSGYDKGTKIEVHVLKRTTMCSNDPALDWNQARGFKAWQGWDVTPLD